MAMKRLRLLGLSLLLLTMACIFAPAVVAEHTWTDSPPMYGKDTDTSGGKQGAEDVFNRWTRQDLFKNSNIANVITANINLLIIDWYTKHELLQVTSVKDIDDSVSRSVEATK